MISLKNNRILAAFLVAGITFLVFLPALQNEFINWDDNRYVLENPHIRSLDLKLLRWAFFDFYYANWHPLTLISHALDYAVWGLKPLGHHLMNNILHALNSFLVVLVIMELMRVPKPQPGKTGFPENRTILIAAWVTGLLFGIHPLHVESVAWVSERKDLLCALFFLLSVRAYTKYAKERRTVVLSGLINRQYLISASLFLFALLSKPMAVTLPVVLMILDWYPFRRISSFRTFGASFLEKLPFFAFSFLSSILTILAQGTGGAIVPVGIVPLWARVLVSARSLIMYLLKMVFPFRMIPSYPYPETAELLSFEYAAAVALVLAATAASIFIVRRNKLWLSVWFYYLITLLPVLGIIQVGGQAMADRYVYLPSIGPFLLAGLGVACVYSNAITRMNRPNAAAFVFSGLVIVLLLVLSLLTVRQIGIWKDSMSLWNYIIEKSSGKDPLAYNKRGVVFHKMDRQDRALADFNKAINLNPAYASAYYNRANLFTEIGRIDKAIEDYDRAIALKPDQYEIYNNRGIAFGMTGRSDRAIDDFERAVKLDPEFSDAYINLGVTYFRMNEREPALLSFKRACDLGNNKGCNAFYDLKELEDRDE